MKTIFRKSEVNRTIALVTGSAMPKPDPETHLLEDELVLRGYKPQVMAWDKQADWAWFSMVLIRTTWDYYKRLPAFLHWVDEVGQAGRLLNPGATVHWNSHKKYLLTLSARGIPTIPTVLIEQQGNPDTHHSLMVQVKGEVVIKPAVSVGAFGALRTMWPSGEAQEHLAHLLREGDVLVQPFVPSVLTEGEVSLIFFRDRFSHAIRKLPQAGEYRVQDHHGGTIHEHQPSPLELDVAQAAMAAAPQGNLYGRVDLVSTPDLPKVMELELIEPTLFLGHSTKAAGNFADAVEEALARA